jgi:predicted alpha/beta-fold hydrolase
LTPPALTAPVDPVAGKPHVDGLPYTPSRRWSGGHRMTLYTWARRRVFPRLPEPEARYFDVAPRARVLAHCYWQAAPRTRGTLLALHGLEGSSSAHYMRGLADKAFARGLNVVLLNQRNCGGTETLSEGLYHSGLSADPTAVIGELVERDRLEAIGVVGYSLGGNLTLKLAGDYGAAHPPQLKAVCAVSPTLDLAACVNALERRANLAYQLNFVRNLRGRMRRKALAWPGRYDLSRLGTVWTVRAFDEAYTAPHHGFRDASDYYHRASALRVVDRIRVPALILSAENDPFVPPEQFAQPEVSANPHIAVVVTRDGGHCGFVAEAPDGYDGYWAEQTAVTFISRYMSVPPT